MEATNYITPTTASPVFQACCNYFGYIERSFYKRWLVNNGKGGICGDTFALSYKEAVNELHTWIEENSSVLIDYPKCKFEISINTGKINRFGEVDQKVVYTITASKAKQLLRFKVK